MLIIITSKAKIRSSKGSEIKLSRSKSIFVGFEQYIMYYFDCDCISHIECYLAVKYRKLKMAMCYVVKNALRLVAKTTLG